MYALPELTSLEVDRAVRERFASVFTSPSVGSRFANPWPHPPLPDFRGVLRWKTKPNVARPRGYRPRGVAIPREPLAAFEELRRSPTRIFWIGHASFLIEADGVRVVVDPIFGRAGGLVKRVTSAAATARELERVDAVLITHGHHDHLDLGDVGAIVRANGGRTTVIVPRGLGRALSSVASRVIELDWWQTVALDALRVVFVPAQHWHRRGVFDTNRGLWGGYVLEGTHRVYHSGDTGYFEGFSAIGAAFSGIDAACLPLGAYEPTWFMATQHMNPEGSFRAYGDLGATHFVGMHWGAFDLSDEPIDAGPRFVEAQLASGAASRDRVHVLSPGGSVALDGTRGGTTATVRHRFEMGDRGESLR